MEIEAIRSAAVVDWDKRWPKKRVGYWGVLLENG